MAVGRGGETESMSCVGDRCCDGDLGMPFIKGIEAPRVLLFDGAVTLFAVLHPRRTILHLGPRVLLYHTIYWYNLEPLPPSFFLMLLPERFFFLIFLIFLLCWGLGLLFWAYVWLLRGRLAPC